MVNQFSGEFIKQAWLAPVPKLFEYFQTTEKILPHTKYLNSSQNTVGSIIKIN